MMVIGATSRGAARIGENERLVDALSFRAERLLHTRAQHIHRSEDALSRCAGTAFVVQMGDNHPVEITVRDATEGELRAVANLRWQWVVEQRGTLATTHAEFVSHFVQWAQERAATHHCTVLLRGTDLIGMAWLAVTPRVPTPGAPRRASGDVQCVYVVPSERNANLGGRLIDTVLAKADHLGLERVTVHSSTRAVSAYARHGFAASPKLLQAECAPSAG